MNRREFFKVMAAGVVAAQAPHLSLTGHGVDINDGKNHHFCMVQEDGIRRYWVDGIEVMHQPEFSKIVEVTRMDDFTMSLHFNMDGMRFSDVAIWKISDGFVPVKDIIDAGVRATINV